MTPRVYLKPLWLCGGDHLLHNDGWVGEWPSVRSSASLYVGKHSGFWFGFSSSFILSERHPLLAAVIFLKLFLAVWWRPVETALQ